MRRGMLVVAGLVLLCAAIPESAQARSLPGGGLLGALFRPIDSVLGGRRVARHRHTRHRAVAARPRRLPAAAAVAAAPAVAVPAANPAIGALSPAAEAPAAVPNSATTIAAAAPATAAGNPPNSEKTSPGAALKSEAPDPANSSAVPAPVSPPNAAQEAAAPVTAAPEPATQSAALVLPATLPRDQPGEAAREQAAPQPEGWPLGVVGPLAWPRAFEDVVGFSLWPRQYGERLHVHGIGDMLGAMFAPAATLAARSRRAATTPTPGAAASAGCGGDVSDWPADAIGRSLSLTERQNAALAQLRAKIADAAATVKASCRDTTTMTPLERLQAMQDTLWAVRDAAVLIRAPLAQFFDSLSEQQKQQFVTAAPASADRDAPARLCGMSKLDAPMRRAEQALHPTGAQRASFEALQKKSFEMGQFLLASCLQPVPSAPTARLDAAANRLTAVIFATGHISVALNDFYSRLDAKQQAQFNSFGQ